MYVNGTSGTLALQLFLALINSRLVQWKVGKYFCGFARYIKLGGEKRISGTMGQSTVQSTDDGRLVGNNKQATNIEFVCPGNLQKPPFQTLRTFRCPRTLTRQSSSGSQCTQRVSYGSPSLRSTLAQETRTRWVQRRGFITSDWNVTSQFRDGNL